MTTWRHEINAVLKGETLVSCTLTDEELDTYFDEDSGSSEGKPFTAWTQTLVLFPVVYGGSEWVGSAPRNPCNKPTEHQGGQ